MSQTQAAQAINKSSISEKFKIKKNEVLNDVLPLVIKYFSGKLIQINSNSGFDNPDHFEDFGPVILPEAEDRHSSRIKYAIDNPGILNLALTGAMGSGKSTILKTFEHKHRQYKCLNISLATFDNNTLETQKIEHNILKQLFYSVEHKKIPASRFKRIENLTGIKYKTFLFILWLCSVSFFFKPELFESVKQTLQLDFYSGVFSFIYGVYFAGFSCVLIFMLMNFILNFKLSKFKIQDVDFDNSQDHKTVSFENEIDEILYFFERNPVDIVFFQDLDRFNKSEIFIKLREINSLINNYEPIKKHRKVTFIYAVCDDIFKEKERAKFFDFIIPVVPVINFTTSSSKLLFKLREDVAQNKLSKDFIDDVSLFLNDYRTIKSIFNEYQIYKSIIGSQLENYNNLLAMMIYKNIEPTDFDRLNLNEGYAYSVLESKKELTSESIQILKDRAAELHSKIEQTQQEKLHDVKELRMVYIFKFFELYMAMHNQPIYGISLASEAQNGDKLLTDEFFSAFIKENNITYYSTSYSSQRSSISFAQVEKAAGRLSYASREQIILNKETESLDRIKTELQEIESRQKDLESKKLYEILHAENADAYFKKNIAETTKINNFKLMHYLLRGGYINEDYNHYISYFHPGSISKEDNDFLLSLLPSQNPLAYGHKLKELKSLIKRIKVEDFSSEAILNLSLVDYLIENNESEKLKLLMQLLSRGNAKVMGFIDEYLQHADELNRGKFFQKLAVSWNGLWIYLNFKSNFTVEKIETYLIYFFSYLNQEELKRTDASGALSDYISIMENLDCFFQSEKAMDSFREFLLKSAVKFEILCYDEKHRELLKTIYTYNLYAINEHMIELFISNFNANKTDTAALKTANYTTIKKSEKKELIQYIDQNLDQYVRNVFLKLPDNTQESQESICAILNREDIESHGDFMQHGQFSVADLSKIENSDIQGTLVVWGKIDRIWKNVLDYYQKTKTIDEYLTEYLNEVGNYTALSSQRFIAGNDDKISKDFIKDLIKSNVSEESFTMLITNIAFNFANTADLDEISESRMKTLIKLDRILLNPVNYSMVKEKFRNLLIFLIESQPAQFMKELAKYGVDSGLIYEILSSNIIDEQEKMAMIEHFSDEDLSEDKRVLVQLGGFLTANRMSSIGFTLLNNLIANALSDERRAELANAYFSSIEDHNLATVIGQLEEFAPLLDGKRPKAGATELNLELIKKLESKLISNMKYSDDKKQIELIPFAKPRF